MSFSFSDEHVELRRTVDRFMQEYSSESEVRRLMETSSGYDVDVWSQMAGQLGLQSLIIPERFGGSGFGFIELAIVLEEMGASLLAAPYFSSVALAANAILNSGDESAMHDFLPGIATGQTIATLAIAEGDGSWELDSVEMRAEMRSNKWQLSGQKCFVIDGHIADLTLVVARTSLGPVLFSVESDARGFSRVQLDTLDQTRKQARLEFDGVEARALGTAGGATGGLRRTLDLAVIALAAEQVGGAQRCLDMAVEYAKVREQFGQVIGSFQAIKHKCANMLVAVETARSALYFALERTDSDSDELSMAASLCKSVCSETYSQIAAENIHIHGGIGFTWEHPAHLYYKRALTCEALFGDASYHRGRIAQYLD